jgi:hypothetical protein
MQKKEPHFIIRYNKCVTVTLTFEYCLKEVSEQGMFFCSNQDSQISLEDNKTEALGIRP